MRAMCLLYTDARRFFLELPVSGLWEFPWCETTPETRDRDMIAKLLGAGIRVRDIRFERLLAPDLAFYTCWITEEFNASYRGVSHGWFPNLPRCSTPDIEDHRDVISCIFASIKESI